ncbi:MAG TPA: hypothetical protein VLH60_03640, partial [Sedimentisphaerales bacterium]|nr:hypothetical protein [Sedimentisphaerales bacterium]
SQGYYGVDVPDMFTGVIKPVKYGYVLVPASRPYSAVTSPLNNQNYTVAAAFFDGFEEGARGAAWLMANDEPDALTLVEQGGKLQLLAAGPDSAQALYRGNSWRLDPNVPFTMKVDFHLGVANVGDANDGWLVFGIADGTGDYISISAGCAGSQKYYRFSAIVDGNSFSAQKPRTGNSGTLYITSDPLSGTVSVSHEEYGLTNAWQTLSCLWARCMNRDVQVFVGGGGVGVALGAGQAWLDNVEINTGALKGWPPPADIDQDGYVGWGDLWYIISYWLRYHPAADINKDGIVDFRDYALTVAGW